MFRYGCVLAAACGLVLMPSLCMAGLLSHACAHSAESAQCGHEEDCPTDPCNVAIVHPSPPDIRSVGSSRLRVSAPVCPATIRPMTIQSHVEPEGGRSRPYHRFPPIPILPFFASDIPLLI